MFSLGNILPDVAPHLRLMSHSKRHSYDYLLKRIEKLSRNRHRSSIYTSLKLGVITHYLADYFCHPHTESFDGSINDHRLYEVGLARYALHNINKVAHYLHAENNGGAKATIDELYRSYQSTSPSYKNDMEYAVKATRSIALALALTSEPLLILPDAVALTELQPVPVSEA